MRCYWPFVVLLVLVGTGCPAKQTSSPPPAKTKAAVAKTTTPVSKATSDTATTKVKAVAKPPAARGVETKAKKSPKPAITKVEGKPDPAMKPFAKPQVSAERCALACNTVVRLTLAAAAGKLDKIALDAVKAKAVKDCPKRCNLFGKKTTVDCMVRAKSTEDLDKCVH